jgi:hypothetical protein
LSNIRVKGCDKMCTSFVWHGTQTLIGMNFDISERPIKLSLQDNGFLVLQRENGQFLPAFGVNANGTFMNLLMVDECEEGKYRRGKNCVHIMRLFDDVLTERIELSDLPSFLAEKTIVNVPHYSVHSMIAGKNVSYIVEPGRANINMSSQDQRFKVLTNFPLSDYAHETYDCVQGCGSERYQTAYAILEKEHTFDVDRAFSILQKTAQTDGEFPTQLSLVVIPEQGIISFTIGQHFHTRFQFSFATQQITGGTKPITLSKKGVLLSELQKA